MSEVAVLTGKNRLGVLGLDLALSRLALACYKLIVGQELVSDDFSAARKLHGHLTLVLEDVRTPQDIPEDVVPEETMRRVLQKTLATMGSVGSTQVTANVNILDPVIDLLSRLLRDQALNRDDAARLSSLVNKLKREPPVNPQRPDLDLYVEMRP